MEKLKFLIARLIKRAKHFSIVSSLCGLALVIILFGEVLVFFYLGKNETLILHYAQIGIDRFGSIWEVFGYGVVGVVMVVVNYAIALELEERDWFWGKAVAVVTLGLAVLLFVAFWATITVN